MEYLLCRRNLRAGSLALLLFLYPIIALSYFQVKYVETIHRLSTIQTFNVSLFGSLYADSLAAVGFGLLYLALSSRKNVSKVVFVGLFVAALAGYVTGSVGLVYGAFVMLPAILVLLAVGAIADRKSPLHSGSQIKVARLAFDGKRVAAAFLVIVIVIEVGALARWVVYPFYPGEMYSDISWKFAGIESALFLSLSQLSPILVVLLAFSFLYRWYLLNGFRKIASTIFPERVAHVEPKRDRMQHAPTKSNGAKTDTRNETPSYSQSPSLVVTYVATKTLTSKHLHLGLLVLALAVAPLLMIYPHLPGINPGGEGVSTDEMFYTKWMEQMRASTGNGTWVDTLTRAFTVNNGDRPISLLLILTISNLTGLPDLMVIRFLPVFLAPALVASNYFLLRHTLSEKQFGVNRVKVFAAIGSVLAVFSPQIVVGEYAGFLANWIALIAAYFAFYLMIKGWESANWTRLSAFLASLFAILVLTMLTHIYTWAHLLAIIVLFTGLSYVMSRKSTPYPKMKVLLMLAVVLAAYSVDYTRALYFSTPGAVDSDSAISSNIQAQDPSGRWDRLYFTLNAYVGGFLSNAPLFLLALVWTVRAKMNGLAILVLSMMFILAAPVAIGSVEFQTRVLQNTPIHLAAVMALMWTGGQIGRHNDDKVLQKFLVIAVIFVMATYALRAMVNLPLELPNGYQLESQFLLS